MHKPIEFLGSSLDSIRRFPVTARQQAGHQLDRVQRGLEPLDFKPMPSVGRGVYEIRLRDASGAFRLLYVSKFEKAIYGFPAKPRSEFSTNIQIK